MSWRAGFCNHVVFKGNDQFNDSERRLGYRELAKENRFQEMNIERIERIEKNAFLQRYHSQSKPLILTSEISDWPAARVWTLDYFKEQLGDETIRVECLPEQRSSDAQYYLKHVSRESVTIKQYLDNDGEDNKHYYAAQIGLKSVNVDLLKQLGEFPYWPKLLRKITRGAPNLWLAKKGCCSALHFDFAPNFFVQIAGRKRWVVFPKSQLNDVYLPSKLRGRHFSPIDMQNPDMQSYPRFLDTTPMEFVLEPGETLYIPAGCAHFVESLDDSIGVNFFWISWSDVFGLARSWVKQLVSRKKSNKPKVSQA